MLRVSRLSNGTGDYNVASSLLHFRKLFGDAAGSMHDPPLVIEWFQSLTENIHNHTGLSWPSTLVACAVGFRAITYPLYANSVAIGRRRSEAGKELAELREMARDAVFLRDPKLLETVDKEYKTRLSSKGLTNNPFQGLGYAALVQFPWTVTMFLSVRDMATHSERFREFTTDSDFMWCPSMALPDPYGILPLMSSLMVLRNLDKSISSSNDSTSKYSVDPSHLRYVMTGATLTFLPLLMQLPCGIVIFFMVNTTFNRLLAPWVHRLSEKNSS